MKSEMETATKFAAISMATNPENGEVTLYVSNEKWGPIVTGKNLSEAKAKMKKAFGLSMLANSYCATMNLKNESLRSEKLTEFRQELKRMTKTVEETL